MTDDTDKIQLIFPNYSAQPVIQFWPKSNLKLFSYFEMIFRRNPNVTEILMPFKHEDFANIMDIAFRSKFGSSQAACADFLGVVPDLQLKRQFFDIHLNQQKTSWKMDLSNVKKIENILISIDKNTGVEIRVMGRKLPELKNSKNDFTFTKDDFEIDFVNRWISSQDQPKNKTLQINLNDYYRLFKAVVCLEYI